MQEHAGAVTLGGQPLTAVGTRIAAGDPAPGFTVVDAGFQTVTDADVFTGVPVMLNSVPSLDTGICDAQTRRFNKEAKAWRNAAKVATFSVDFPSALRRWCGAADLEHTLVYSDHKDLSFGHAYGLAIKESRQLSRAVFVVDSNRIVRYVEYVREIGSHPDYAGALKAVEDLL